MAKILVIDDSPTVSITVAWTLRNYGWDVHIVHDGLAALNELRVFDPDLVLLDIGLPHINGIQLCEMIRTHTNYTSLPIVILSGHSKETDIQRAMDAGANDYLVKPVEEGKLLASIEHYLAPTDTAVDARK